MSRRQMNDGRADGLVPLESLRIDEVESFGDLLRFARPEPETEESA